MNHAESRTINDYKCEAQINRVKVGVLRVGSAKTITNGEIEPGGPARWSIFEVLDEAPRIQHSSCRHLSDVFCCVLYARSGPNYQQSFRHEH